MEQSYRGGTGHDVRWKLESIETLDLLGDVIDDGREVYSEPAEVPDHLRVDFETTFQPEKSTPGNSGV